MTLPRHPTLAEYLIKSFGRKNDMNINLRTELLKNCHLHVRMVSHVGHARYFAVRMPTREEGKPYAGLQRGAKRSIIRGTACRAPYDCQSLNN